MQPDPLKWKVIKYLNNATVPDVVYSRSTENPAVVGKMVMAFAIQTNPFTEHSHAIRDYMGVCDDGGGGGGQKTVKTVSHVYTSTRQKGNISNKRIKRNNE